MTTKRTFYKKKGKYFSDVLKQFVFPYYNEIVNKHYKAYFDYDVTTKIISEFTFVGYNLAKYIDIKDTDNISNNCFTKAFIFLDGWSNIKTPIFLPNNRIACNKHFDQNQMQFKIYNNYNTSISTLRISDKYIKNHISYNLFTNTLTKIEDLADTYSVLDNCEQFIKELKDFIRFTREVIIKELCEKWREDCYTYLISAKFSEEENNA